MRASYETIEITVTSVQFYLEETIKDWAEDILTSVDQQTQGLYKKINSKTGESQLGFHVPLYVQPKPP